MQARQRGISTAGVIAVIVVLVLVAGAAAYFLSDPFRTKTDEAYTQFAKWTPENIAKDPVNYLNFAEGEAKAAQQKLKASEIAVAQKRAALEGMRDDAKAKVAAGEKALTELKEGYKKAAADGSWPIKWQGSDRTEEWTKRQIMSFHTQVESQKTLQDKVQRGIGQLDAQVNTIQTQKAKLDEQLATIATNREMLKVQQITDDLKQQLVNLKGVLQTTMATVDATEGDSVVSLDAITQQTAGTVDDAEFAKILNQ